jgi:heme-degrading monooxygenase HmoA
MAIIEHALLPVRAGDEAAFEEALVKARPLIAASPGFISMTVRRPVGTKTPYLLLVEWRSVGDHCDGFRQSDRYHLWCALLHPFYDLVPMVSYFGDDL